MKNKTSLEYLLHLAVLVATLSIAGSAACAQTANEFLDVAGLKGGLVVHIGCGEGELTASLRVSDRFLVHGLDADPVNVNKARNHISSLDLYGPVSVDVFDGTHLPYTDDLVNLVIADEIGDVSTDEIMRVLCPNGVLLTKKDGEWNKTVKPWPKDIDEWTHNMHGADNNGVATDTRVGPPRHLRWLGGPAWARHHDVTPSVSCFVSAHGRVFYIIDETPTSFTDGPETWFLVARDAFNGMLLWKKPVPEWGQDAWSTVWHGGYYGRFEHPQLGKRLVAVGDTVYVTLGYNAPVTALDAATGEGLWSGPESEFVDEIAVDDGILFASAYRKRQEPAGRDSLPIKKYVCAYDTETHTRLWASEAYQGINPKSDELKSIVHLFITVGSKRVFAVDGDEVVALDKGSGTEVWRKPLPAATSAEVTYGFNTKGMCKLVASEDILLVSQLTPDQYNKGRNDELKPYWDRPTSSVLRAYAPDGKILWTAPAGTWGHHSLPELYVINELVWIHDKEAMAFTALDLKTGEVKKRRDTRDAFENAHHHRCYENRVTEKYMISSFRGLEFMPWDSTETDHNHWVRGACQLGVFPCNGLIYALPHPCDCYITSKLTGFAALSASVNANVRGDSFQKGKAYGQVLTDHLTEAATDDWPMHRHDPSRSSATNINIPENLTKAWQTDLKAAELTAPVISGGTVLVASKVTASVYALDADTGAQRWQYTTGGPIDSPPTVYRGLVLAGSADGWVYCLRKSDGALVWRFRAAPEDRLVCAFGRLESAWPVHGSVLVENGNAYVTAGRSSYLDGGFYTYRLDPATGQVLERDRIQSASGKKTDWGRSPDVDYGLLSDILVSNGTRIFMRQRSVFGPEYTGPVWGEALASWGGLLDDSWFNRAMLTLDGVPYGALLAYDKDTVFAVRAGRVPGSHASFNPGQGEYLLVATDRHPTKPAGRKWIGSNSMYPKLNKWERNIPVRIVSLVCTTRLLFGAGTRDAIDDASNPWKTYRGEGDGVLMGFDTKNGNTVLETALDSAPVYDGMAAANSALFISLKNGNVVCFHQNNAIDMDEARQSINVLGTVTAAE